MARLIVLILLLFRLAGAFNFRNDYSLPSSPPSRSYSRSVALGATSWASSVAVWGRRLLGPGRRGCRRLLVQLRGCSRRPGLVDVQYLSENSAWLLRAGGGGAAASYAFLKASSNFLFVRAGWGRKTCSCASNEVGVRGCHHLLKGFVD